MVCLLCLFHRWRCTQIKWRAVTPCKHSWGQPYASVLWTVSATIAIFMRFSFGFFVLLLIRWCAPVVIIVLVPFRYFFRILSLSPVMTTYILIANIISASHETCSFGYHFYSILDNFINTIMWLPLSTVFL